MAFYAECMINDQSVRIHCDRPNPIHLVDFKKDHEYLKIQRKREITISLSMAYSLQ